MPIDACEAVSDEAMGLDSCTPAAGAAGRAASVKVGAKENDCLGPFGCTGAAVGCFPDALSLAVPVGFEAFAALLLVRGWAGCHCMVNPGGYADVFDRERT